MVLDCSENRPSLMPASEHVNSAISAVSPPRVKAGASVSMTVIEAANGVVAQILCHEAMARCSCRLIQHPARKPTPYDLPGDFINIPIYV